MNLGYLEHQEKLNKRIEAHQKYSTFDLLQWLRDHLAINPGSRLIDLGCGTGNFFNVYEQKLGTDGLLVGADLLEEVLREAQTKHISTPFVPVRLDMNAPLPFFADFFNAAIASFSIYYVGDVGEVLREICRILKPDGQMILMGPTTGNAQELYAFNRRLYGIGMDIKTETRTRRLEAEFLPVVKGCFHQTTVRYLNGQLQFPDEMEFIKYYRSSLLYRESEQRFQKSFTDPEMAAHVQSPWVVTKQMVVIQASQKKV